MQSNEKRYITALRRESGLFSTQNFNVNFATADKKANERTQNNVKCTNKRKLSAQDKARRTTEIFAYQLAIIPLVEKYDNLRALEQKCNAYNERKILEKANAEKNKSENKQRFKTRFK